MGCLIADSGPLIALAKLGLLDLPARLFGRAVLPETVFAECMVQAGLPDAQAIRAAVEAAQLEVVADRDWPAGAEPPRLDAGELAVLSLDGHLGATVLMDERRGRQAARRLGYAVVGVCGLLPPLRPIPIKERLSVLYVERGNLDVLDGAFVVVDVKGVRTHRVWDERSPRSRG